MKPKLRTWLTRAFWLGLLGGLLYWALRFAPLNEIWASLRRLQLWQIGLLLVLNLGVIACMTMRWWIIVRAGKASLPFIPLMGYRLSVFALSYFTPGPQVGGEPLQVVYLQRNHGLTYARATAAVIMDKLLEFLGNILFLALGLIAIFRLGWLSSSGLQLTGSLIPLAAILLWPPTHIALLYNERYPLSGLARAVKSRLPAVPWIHTPARLLIVAERMAGTFTRRHIGALLASLGVSLLAWAGMVTEYWLMASFTGISISPWQSVAGLTSMQIAFMAPLPAGLGVVEASQVFALTAMGFSTAAGLTMSLLMRGRDILFGGVGLLLASNGISVK